MWYVSCTYHTTYVHTYHTTHTTYYKLFSTKSEWNFYIFQLEIQIQLMCSCHSQPAEIWIAFAIIIVQVWNKLFMPLYKFRCCCMIFLLRVVSS